MRAIFNFVANLRPRNNFELCRIYGWLGFAAGWIWQHLDHGEYRIALFDVAAIPIIFALMTTILRYPTEPNHD